MPQELKTTNDRDQNSSTPSACEREGGGETTSEDGTRRSPRADKKRVHATRHGILTRQPLETLARCGENIRQLRHIERRLREELGPDGILAEILFDRMWSAYLRCVLIARAEARLVIPVNQGTSYSDLPTLQERDLPTLVSTETGATDNVISIDLIEHLANVVRYDSHFSKEFYRALGLLLATKSSAESKLTRLLVKASVTNREILEGSDE